MRKLYLILPLVMLAFLFPASLKAQYFPAQGWCEDGNIPVVTSGISSTNPVQASYSACTVTVIIHGGGAATIYSTDSGTPLANPFTAATNGQWEFFADAGRYDITITGGTPALPAPVTFDSTLILSGAAVTSFSSGDLSPIFTTSVATATTTPALSFSLSNASAYTVLGRCTGTTGAPSYCSLVNAMLPAPGSSGNGIYNTGGLFGGMTGTTWDNTARSFSVVNAGATAWFSFQPGTISFASAGGTTAPMLSATSGLSLIGAASDDLTFGQAGNTNHLVLPGNDFGRANLGAGANEGELYLNDGTSGAGTFLGPELTTGVGSPESAITARVGSLYLRSDGNVGTSLYIKQTGTGSTGWAADSCVAASTCTSTLFTGGDGAVGAPTYSFASALTSGTYWTGTQLCWTRVGVGQLCTNGGPGITSSGTVCMTTTTRCFNANTTATTLDPFISVTGGAVLFAPPLVAGNPTTTGWSSNEKGGTYFNTTANIPRYWNGTVLMDFGAPLYDGAGTLQTAAHAVQASCVLGTDCAVTLTGASVFTSSTSYTCNAQDQTAAAATKIVQASGSGFTITGTGTDSIRYSCIGN